MKRTVGLLLPAVFSLCVLASSCVGKAPPASSQQPSGAGVSSPASSSGAGAASSSGVYESTPFAVSDVKSPVSADETAACSETALPELNARFSDQAVSEAYFLDARTVLFSVKARTGSDGLPEYDLYRYDLEQKTIKLLCENFMLYSDDTVAAENPENFSVWNGTEYLKVENGRVASRHSFAREAQKAGLTIGDAFYNEQAGKLLFEETDAGGNVVGAYLSGLSFAAPQKLPFSGVYRVQWADPAHILAAYRDGGKSVLALYGLKDQSTVLTVLPDGNFFLDPQICDDGSLAFLYLEPRDSAEPFGILRPQTGEMARVLFQSANPRGLMRQGRMAFFSQAGTYPDIRADLLLYDAASNRSILRAERTELPVAAAVSPDGKDIFYVTSHADGGKVSFAFHLNAE